MQRLGQVLQSVRGLTGKTAAIRSAIGQLAIEATTAGQRVSSGSKGIDELNHTSPELHVRLGLAVGLCSVLVACHS
jgi:hypothetical protein